MRLGNARKLILGLLAAALVAASARTSTAAPSAPQAGQVSDQEAAAYAASVGVSISEARSRLELQPAIGQFGERLAAAMPDVYAGMFVDHTPKFRIVVLMTKPDLKRVLTLGADPRLSALIDVEPADHRLVDLEADRSEAAKLAADIGLRNNSDIDVRSNRAELYVEDAAEFTSRLASAHRSMPPRAHVVEKQRLLTPASDIYGGLATGDCTTGFSVQSPSGYRGFTVAGHCSDTQFYNGAYFAYMGGTPGIPNDNRDIQWNWESGYQARNWVWTGSYTLSIYYVMFRSSQYVGEYVCKYGKTTGGGCGFITSTYTDGTFVRTNVTIAAGDSGGPWFQNQAAFGTTVGYYGPGDSVYLPVDYIYSVLGASVITN